MRAKSLHPIVRPEESESLKPFSMDLQVLLSAEATGGAISVLMSEHRSGEGPPPHLHYSQEEQVRWAKAMPNIAKEWVRDMDKQKLLGSKALTQLMAEARQAGIKPVRDWDKE